MNIINITLQTDQMDELNNVNNRADDSLDNSRDVENTNDGDYFCSG